MDELKARIDAEITQALGYDDELSDQRRLAMEYYYGLPFGNEVEGRSQMVDSTVADTIEWIKPSLMRVFASGDRIVEFHPTGPEDIPAAEQASDYINHIFTKDNPGFEILYSWFTDALLQKNGIVKCWWDETDENDRETYTDLTDLELDALIAPDNVEVLEHSENTDGLEVTHDVVITRKVSKGRVRIENVPPEEFLISREAKSIEDARFVCHRTRKTYSELREMGYDFDEDELGGDSLDHFTERLARFEFDRSDAFGRDTTEKALQEVWVYESYLKSDQDDDGIAELLRVVTAGNIILEQEPVDRKPFSTLTPIKIPHKFFGLSMADLTMDLQLMKSTLQRNLLDNMYMQNHGRFAVMEGQVNLDDLLTSRPGGIVRTKTPNAVTPLPTPPLQPYVFETLKYLDGIREERSGMTKYSQGLNEGALTSHTTAAAVNQTMTAAQQRVELIARCFAETGVKHLMEMIYELVQKNQDKERIVMLRNQFVPVRPDMWREKMDCTVAVGLGHGNRDQHLTHLTTLLTFASQAMRGGLSIINEMNLYNIGAEMIKNMGFKNVDAFITDPRRAQQGQDPREQMAMAEMQLKKGELDIKVAETQIKQQKLQLEAQKMQSDNAMKVAELQLEAVQGRPVGIG
jgi:hypothetical protein